MTISQKHILVLSICAIETALLTLQLVTTGNIPWVNIREGSWIVVVIMLLPVVFTVLHSAWSFSWRFTALLMGVGGAVGFLFEEIGLTYGVVFGGQYSYPQHTLLIAQVPILVVLYWPLFIYLSYCLSNAVFRWFSGIDRFPTKAIPFLLIADGFIAVSIDLFLDPIQVQLGSWQWHANGWYYGIPIGNFVGWFLVTIIVTGIIRFAQARNHRAYAGITGPLWNALPVGGYILLYGTVATVAILNHNQYVVLHSSWVAASALIISGIVIAAGSSMQRMTKSSLSFFL